MENWKLLLAGIRNALSDLVSKTFNVNGSVEVSNLPEVQHVVIDNHQEPTETVVVSNLVDYKEELNKIIGELIKVPKDIKTADYSPIIDALKEVVRTLEDDKTDYSPIILSIESAVKELKTKFPEVDYSEIINTIKGIQQFNLGDYLYEGELPVIINDKQIRKLVDAFGKKTSQVIAASGSGFSEIKVKNASNVVINPATEEKQDAIITAIGGISGGSGYEVVGIKDSSDTRIDPATETTLANVDSTLSSMDLTVNDINTALGEVQASPTANTVLDRLKAIKTSVDSATPAGTNLIGKVGIDQTTDGTTNKVYIGNTVNTKGLPSDIDINGSNANHADKFYTNAGAVTDGIVWSPAAGKRWHILTLYINVSAAATVTLEDDLAAGDNVRWKGELAANSGVVIKYDKEHPFCSGEDAADLLITTTAGNVYVQAVGYEI